MAVSAEERTALALAALAEVTDPSDVGDLLEAEQIEPGVIDLRFACSLPGYIGWRWTVSTSDLPDADPTVLEVELVPGEGALLAPPWVPWTERLAEWRRLHPDGDPAVDLVVIEDDDLEDDVEDDEDDDLDGEDDLDDDVLEGVEVDEVDVESELGVEPEVDDHDEGQHARD